MWRVQQIWLAVFVLCARPAEPTPVSVSNSTGQLLINETSSPTLYGNHVRNRGNARGDLFNRTIVVEDYQRPLVDGTLSAVYFYVSATKMPTKTVIIDLQLWENIQGPNNYKLRWAFEVPVNMDENMDTKYMVDIPHGVAVTSRYRLGWTSREDCPISYENRKGYTPRIKWLSDPGLDAEYQFMSYQEEGQFSIAAVIEPPVLTLSNEATTLNPTSTTDIPSEPKSEGMSVVEPTSVENKIPTTEPTVEPLTTGSPVAADATNPGPVLGLVVGVVLGVLIITGIITALVVVLLKRRKSERDNKARAMATLPNLHEVDQPGQTGAVNGPGTEAYESMNVSTREGRHEYTDLHMNVKPPTPTTPAEYAYVGYLVPTKGETQSPRLPPPTENDSYLTMHGYTPNDSPLPEKSPKGSPLPEKSPNGSPLPEKSLKSSPIPGLSAKSSPLPGFSAKSTPLPGLSAKSSPLPGLSAKSSPLPGLSAKSSPLPGLSAKSSPLPGLSAKSAPVDDRSPKASPAIERLPLTSGDYMVMHGEADIPRSVSPGTINPAFHDSYMTASDVRDSSDSKPKKRDPTPDHDYVNTAQIDSNPKSGQNVKALIARITAQNTTETSTKQNVPSPSKTRKLLEQFDKTVEAPSANNSKHHSYIEIIQ